MPAQECVGYEFTSASNEGAILVLPEGADQHDLLSLRHHLIFEGEANRNGRPWYEFALRMAPQMTISSDSLYLITGYHKTSSSSLATFHQPYGNSSFCAQFMAAPLVDDNPWKMTSAAISCQTGYKSYKTTERNQTVFIRGYRIAIREDVFLELRQGEL